MAQPALIPAGTDSNFLPVWSVDAFDGSRLIIRDNELHWGPLIASITGHGWFIRSRKNHLLPGSACFLPTRWAGLESKVAERVNDDECPCSE